jgi:hypothetical protein
MVCQARRSIYGLPTSDHSLRSDFIYMVPPFLAMYGAIHKNTTVMDEAYNQIKLYRDILRDSSGLWKHIAGEGNGLDKGTHIYSMYRGVSASPILGLGRPLVHWKRLGRSGDAAGCRNLPSVRPRI